MSSHLFMVCAQDALFPGPAVGTIVMEYCFVTDIVVTVV